MAVAFRSVASSTGTDSSGEGTIPSGTATNDIMLAFVVHNSSSATISVAASGWDLLIDDPNPADYSLWCYKRIFASGDSNPTWTFSVAGNWTIDIVSYSGNDTTTPIDASGGNQSAAVNTKTTASLTPSVTGCMLVAHGSVDASGSARTWTETGAMTERVETADNQLHRLLAEELLSTSGSGVTRDLTVSGTAQDLATFAVLIRPAAGGTQYTQSASGGLTPDSILTKQDQKPLTGSMVSSGSIVKQVQKFVSGTLSTIGTLVKNIATSFVGTVTASGGVLKTFLRSMVGTGSAQGALTAQTSKNISGSLTNVGTIIKLTRVALSGTLNSAGILNGIKTVLLSLTGLLGSSGSLAKQTTKLFSSGVTLNGIVAKLVSKINTATLTVNGILEVSKTVFVSISGMFLSTGTLVIQNVNTIIGRIRTTVSGIKGQHIFTGRKGDQDAFTGRKPSITIEDENE